MKRLYVTLIASFLLTSMGVLVLYLLLPKDFLTVKPTCTSYGFARRWDGTCSGWTKELCMKFIFGHLMHWWAYTTIAMCINYLHPVMRKQRWSIVTVKLTALFVFGCGLTHLVAVYTIFNPRYDIEAIILLTNGIISVTAMFFVAYGLSRTIAMAAERNRELEKLTGNTGKYL